MKKANDQLVRQQKWSSHQDQLKLHNQQHRQVILSLGSCTTLLRKERGLIIDSIMRLSLI